MVVVSGCGMMVRWRDSRVLTRHVSGLPRRCAARNDAGAVGLRRFNYTNYSKSFLVTFFQKSNFFLSNFFETVCL
jgi:hypothetical protein